LLFLFTTRTSPGPAASQELETMFGRHSVWPTECFPEKAFFGKCGRHEEYRQRRYDAARFSVQALDLRVDRCSAILTRAKPASLRWARRLERILGKPFNQKSQILLGSKRSPRGTACLAAEPGTRRGFTSRRLYYHSSVHCTHFGHWCGTLQRGARPRLKFRGDRKPGDRSHREVRKQ